MINSKQRSKLRSLAHHLKPIVSIGKSGLTEGAIHSIDTALDAHELIKVKFNMYKESKNEFIANQIESLSAFIVGDIGHTLIIFRPQKDKDKRKITL